MRKWLRWTLGILAFLSACVAILWWEENQRGRRIWEETCARLRAAGEPVELADIIPPRIPDEENVAMAPIFAEVSVAGERARLAQMVDAFDGHPIPRNVAGEPMATPRMKPIVPD